MDNSTGRTLSGPQTDRTVQAALTHISNAEQLTHEKPFEILTDTTEPGCPQTNMVFAPTERITIRDARSRGRSNFTLDQTGFEFADYDFDDRLTVSAIREPCGEKALWAYMARLGEFMKGHFGAEKVILYDWRIRSTLPDVTWPRTADRFLQLPPAAWTHADESALCGRKIVREHLIEDEQDRFDAGEGRFRIVNIWRPLVPVVAEKPLALCDWSSVDSSDWELCDQVHQDRVDEAMYLKHRPGHRWWWLPDQRQDELAFFVVWDSFKFGEGRQASTPHVAFDLPGPGSGKSRESVEVRSIVWTKT